jgi:hypothetical protein
MWPTELLLSCKACEEATVTTAKREKVCGKREGKRQRMSVAIEDGDVTR